MATYALATDATLKEVVAYMAMDHDPLNDLDGTAATYKKVMRKWFHAEGASADSTPEELTALCDKWYEETRETWVGYTEFYQPDVSALATGTKGGDNADLTCTPSTDTVEGQDDYAGLPLFACVDVNWTVDEETLEPMITAIDGITSNFKRKDPDVYVGVMQQSCYHFWEENDETYIHGVSAYPDVPYENVAPVAEAVKASDNTFRQWVVHAKYMAGYDAMTCCSGTNSGTYVYSHNTIHTKSHAIGTQYSGSTVADDAWLKLMAYIKYGSLTLDGILQGCVNDNYEYPVSIGEEGVRRVILTTTQAANLEVGERVIIGTYDSTASSPTDRGTAALYSVTGQAGALITSIESVTFTDDDEVETEYAAVYVDTDDTFDTVANGTATEGTTYIADMPWDTGKTDKVLGNDGSPTSCTSGKYPAKLQGIEFATGCTETYADVIWNLYLGDDEETYYYEPYVCRLSANQSTAITDNYEAMGEPIEQPESDSWTYIKKLAMHECMSPIEVGGSSSTYTKDGFYMNGGVTGTRSWRAFGALNAGSAIGGLSYVYGCHSLSGTSWGIGARLSPNGNRGEWTA